MRDRFFTDEELTAFLDGEEEFAPMEAIASALESDPALAKRLEALDLDRAMLAESFAGLQPDPAVLEHASAGARALAAGDSATLGGPLAGPGSRFGRLRGLWVGAAGGAVAAALVIGFALGSVVNPARQGWAEYVAAYQALYSNSTLAHIDLSTAEKQAQLDRVSASIGKSIAIDKLEVFPEVKFARSQILSFKGKPLIQLAFLTSTGEPLALCIMRASDPVDKAPELRRMEGLSTALWDQNGYRYILIGGQDDALIGRMSASLSGLDV
ncbi:hypothetical protein [Phaeobacter sp.]|uniref:anti-sigma factor family protein n=1 Tax=Phaeobacter sp. TaxID=1902409 RepID=UPI0025FCAF65|nr:hypothetical protein [Phaeobacter sp.]